MKRNVFFAGEPLPDDGETYVEVPKGNDRMWEITLHNRGRTRVGTATVYRLTALLQGIKRRYPKVTKSPPSRPGPIVVRRERAGKIVAIVKSLDGPVASIATRQ